jgi:hypothetical protein
MSVINPVSPELSETPTLEKGDIKKDMEEATPADPPAPSVRHGLVTAEYRMDIPVEQLQRNFKRAAWLSLALTLIVTIVSCPYSRCKEFIGLTIRAGYTIADVFFPLCVFPNVLPLLDNLLHGEFFFVFFLGGGGALLGLLPDHYSSARFGRYPRAYSASFSPFGSPEHKSLLSCSAVSYISGQREAEDGQAARKARCYEAHHSKDITRKISKRIQCVDHIVYTHLAQNSSRVATEYIDKNTDDTNHSVEHQCS